ncbi:glutaredoxin [mine drainage metagenome]|uniref:Glutaredoxin n=1 Tax=mine drainage metagenome TaxID=410659 RepID=A0A1J5SJK2_9ZZZZ
MKIRAYLKPSCGWSNGVRAVLRKYSLEYEDVDVVNSPANYEEMARKSGQGLSPCVEIDGVMLADVSGEEVENYLLSNQLVAPSQQGVDVSINSGCNHENHAARAAQTTRFF